MPGLDSNETLRERFFGGVKKPIFTSSTVDNHLVIFAEVMAMYLLGLGRPRPPAPDHTAATATGADEQHRYAREQVQLDRDSRYGLPGGTGICPSVHIDDL